jgi:hypothetical protein
MTDISRAAPDVVVPVARVEVTGSRSAVRRFVHDNALALVVFGLFFLTFIVGQTLAGQHAYNADQRDHGELAVSYVQYLTTAHFGEATFENWESEFLQMGSYVLLTAWLFQRGSSESKRFDGDDEVDEDPRSHSSDPEAPWPVRRGGVVLRVYENSLALAVFALFFLSWWLHAVMGAREYSAEELAHGGRAVDTVHYVGRAQFWFESLQNWQSEFLAVASIVVLTIFLRQKGSPESKPVHAPHHATGR